MLRLLFKIGLALTLMAAAGILFLLILPSILEPHTLSVQKAKARFKDADEREVFLELDESSKPAYQKLYELGPKVDAVLAPKGSIAHGFAGMFGFLLRIDVPVTTKEDLIKENADLPKDENFVSPDTYPIETKAAAKFIQIFQIAAGIAFGVLLIITALFWFKMPRKPKATA